MRTSKTTRPLSLLVEDLEEGTSLWKDAWLRLKKNKLSIVCVLVFILITLLCYLGPYFSPYTYEGIEETAISQGPSWKHWMGTDDLGRDLLTRILYGGRVSLGVGFLATLVSLTIGVLYGSFSGYIGGKTDVFMMRIVDILYALPFMIFVILLTVIFGSSMLLLFLAIGAVEWLTMARIVRGQILSLKKQEFIEAAVSLGLSNKRIILRHLIPNILGIIIIYSTLTVPAVMLLEAILSFLGLGIQPPGSSWGILIKHGADNMEIFPWMLLFPALFFSLTLFSLNFLGDGLRDALDPKSSKD